MALLAELLAALPALPILLASALPVLLLAGTIILSRIDIWCCGYFFLAHVLLPSTFAPFAQLTILLGHLPQGTSRSRNIIMLSYLPVVFAMYMEWMREISQVTSKIKAMEEFSTCVDSLFFKYGAGLFCGHLLREQRMVLVYVVDIFSLRRSYRMTDGSEELKDVNGRIFIRFRTVVHREGA